MGDGFRPARAHPLNWDEEGDERSGSGCWEESGCPGRFGEEKWVSRSSELPFIPMNWDNEGDERSWPGCWEEKWVSRI